MRIRTILLLSLLFISFPIWAQPFQIVNRQYGALGAADIAAVDALLDELEADVNSQLPDADQSTYLRGMANANVMSGKGTSDYANDVKFFLLKYSWGLGADLGDNRTKDILNGTLKPKQFRGAGFQFGFTFGLNMGIIPIKKIGPWESKKTDLFVHFSNLNSTSDDGSFTIISKAFALFARYHLMPEKEIIPFGGLSWKGVYFTTGFETHDMLLKLGLNVAVTESIGLGSATLSGSALAGVDVQTLSIPFELSTGFQWMYFFTTYLGLGLDYNNGEAKSLASSNTSLTTDIAGVSGEGVLDLGTTDGPSPIWMRWFIGQQFNIGFLKINAQIDHVPGKGYWGVNAGVGLTY